MEWMQVSGRVSEDAAYAMALAKQGWRRWQEAEERRLLSVYGQEHLQAIHLRLKDMGYRPLVPLAERQRRYGGRYE